MDPAAGRAHGMAGVAEFLFTLVGRTSDDLILAAAADRARQLADRTRALLQQADSIPLPI
ncbi:MAG TPA: hypothetical protein VGL63_13310 [Streptosporangiaceae bacterium]